MRSVIFRKLLLLVADALIVTLSYSLAYWLRVDIFSSQFVIDGYKQTFWATLPWLLAIRLLCGIMVRQYNWSFRQASLQEAFSIATGVVAGTILFIAVTYLGNIYPANVGRPPQSVYFLESAATLAGMGLVRFLPRYILYFLRRRSTHFAAGDDKLMRTVIFGAGHMGQLLLRDILYTGSYPYRVVGVIDDDPVKTGVRVMGVPVLGNLDDLPEIIQRRRVNRVLIAISALPAERLRKLVEICTNTHVTFKKIPNYLDIIQQGAKPLALQDLKLEDLLRREPVKFDHAALAEFFVGKTALVTGAAGSIGSELCRQLAGLGLRKIVAVDINENELYFLNLEMMQKSDVTFTIAFGSIRDRRRLDEIFAQHQPDIVFHAAAHKHVPLMEHCPREALANNVLGTINVAESARRHGAERFVLISTDKAVRPANVMGASKHLAERAVERIGQGAEGRFMAVRFGNVLGSAGSLIPILQRQISKGGPVTITHPQMTRYFMTIPEAVGLVIIAAVQNEGTLCVLDMGEPVKIDEIARHLINLNGLIPEEDIPIKYIGLRPGEKMYEELFLEQEKLTRSSHPRIMVAQREDCLIDLEWLKEQIGGLVERGDDAQARDFLHRTVPGMPPERGLAEKKPEK